MARLVLWAAVLAAMLNAGPAMAQEGPTSPDAPAAAAPGAPASPATPAAEPSEDLDAGPSLLLGVGGIVVGAVGLVAGAALLVVGQNQKTDAKDISTAIQAEMPGTSPCGGPQAHPSCDDLASSADKGVIYSTAGFLLLAGGGALALSGALYLGVGGDRGGQSASLQVAPAVGPGQWGATMRGTF